MVFQYASFEEIESPLLLSQHGSEDALLLHCNSYVILVNPKPGPLQMRLACSAELDNACRFHRAQHVHSLADV